MTKTCQQHETDGLRSYNLDGAKLWFDRKSGLTVLQRDESTRGLRRSAPRVIQFGATNHCNLACGFCSRDVAAPSLWDGEGAFKLLRDLAAEGVMEVAFGGGEPLVMRGFDELVRRLSRETPLAVSFTTNGALLTEERIAGLAPYVAQVRVSIYDDQDWRTFVRRLTRSSICFGANLLVTPGRLREVAGTVLELVRLGCEDVLLLGYTGDDDSLHLSGEQDAELSATVRVLHAALHGRARISVDACFGDRLDVPRLDLGGGLDCGAGNDSIVIGPDRRLYGCSFDRRGIAVEGGADVLRLWRESRSSVEDPPETGGCARRSDHGLQRTPKGIVSTDTRDGWFVYRAFASNNSGSYTLLGRFESGAVAKQVAEALSIVCADHDRWNRREVPIGDQSPLDRFAEAHGLHGRFGARPDEDDWPEAYSKPPTVLAVARQVLVHVEYTISMPALLGEFMYAKDGRVATELDHSHGPIVMRADAAPRWSETGRGPETERLIESAITDLSAAVPSAELIARSSWGGIQFWSEADDPVIVAEAIDIWAKSHLFDLWLHVEEGADELDPLRDRRRGRSESE